MKETKVYVDELPKSCFECPIMVDGSEGCDFCVCAILEEKATTKNRLNDCPLKSLHDHDKELIAKVLKEVEDSFTAYLPLRNRTGAWFYGRLNEILKKYQKEFEDGK